MGLEAKALEQENENTCSTLMARRYGGLTGVWEGVEAMPIGLGLQGNRALQARLRLALVWRAEAGRYTGMLHGCITEGNTFLDHISMHDKGGPYSFFVPIACPEARCWCRKEVVVARLAFDCCCEG